MARILKVMRKSAAVLCQDERSLETLAAMLDHLGTELRRCRSNQEALELVMAGECCTLIVDFDLPGAEETVRMATLLPPAQKPNLLAVASRAWPGTGQAFQSGASRILYRPLQPELVKDALKAGEKKYGNRRKSARYELKTMVYLEIGQTTMSAVSIDIGEHGLAVQASEPVPIHANIPFHCVLPGTHVTLNGHVDVIWASDQGRAGLFFSKLAPAARKHLKQWLSKRGSHHKRDLHDLMPGANDHVEFASTEKEALTETE
jgi:CheY-like chemotaxis protein